MFQAVLERISNFFSYHVLKIFCTLCSCISGIVRISVLQYTPFSVSDWMDLRKILVQLENYLNVKNVHLKQNNNQL